ncbi:MAG: DUF3373 family protein [Bryobacteraceae bacterium]
MRRVIFLLPLALLAYLAGPMDGARAQTAPPRDGAPQAASENRSTSSGPESTQEMKQELEQLKKAVAALEQRLKAQEEQAQAQKAPQPAQPQQADNSEIASTVKELDQRVSETERGQALDRLHFTGDYRFEAHSINGRIPAHYDGMQLQNLMVKAMFATPILGRPPASVSEINNTVSANYANYLQFSNNLTFNQLKQGMASFPAAMQQQLFGMLMPSTYTPAYNDNNSALFTNRLRLNFDAKVADNISFSGRLAMYKVFGDSTGVQVFNGQPTSMNVDGTTSGVPNSDQVRVERAYFSWNNIGNSKLYLSIGRRPSTGGPPLNYRQDELRGGTPSGALIDYQFDGITLGYKLSDNMIWRLCWGLGYESGWGNANLLKMPQDRLKDSHFLGANLDLWNTDDTLVQATYAHAFNVTDGFNGMVVLTVNPLTGDPVNAPVVMRYTPSANLGAIHLFGMNVTHKAKAFDMYVSGNFSATRPNGVTTPFGGLMSDPFETPVNRSGYMVLAGLRYNFPNDEKTKVGFEFNHGSKYWFNFAQAEDDIIAPKTDTRGNVFEAYLTHQINSRFIFKGDFIKYLYDFSGSGWHVGAPKALDSTPTLGFPTYINATMFTVGVTTRF